MTTKNLLTGRRSRLCLLITELHPTDMHRIARSDFWGVLFSSAILALLVQSARWLIAH
jgi:hypothetical protein